MSDCVKFTLCQGCSILTNTKLNIMTLMKYHFLWNIIFYGDIILLWTYHSFMNISFYCKVFSLNEMLSFHWNVDNEFLSRIELIKNWVTHYMVSCNLNSKMLLQNMIWYRMIIPLTWFILIKHNLMYCYCHCTWLKN